MSVAAELRNHMAGVSEMGDELAAGVGRMLDSFRIAGELVACAIAAAAGNLRALVDALYRAVFFNRKIRLKFRERALRRWRRSR